ncbi:clan AA aspartic protease [Treponema primitia]|uniref:clan AA aspartic protease n=1 Tax=Treponema primitia TaxID=88058 RepID=UPI003980461B
MMGTVYEEITLKNVADLTRVEEGLIKESGIRQMTLRCVVDTGAGTLVISEAVQNELGLRTKRVRESTLANGEKTACKIAETVEIQWKDRSMTCEPWVLPEAPEVLLGAIPLENMDLMVDPMERKLVGVHGDQPVGMIY